MKTNYYELNGRIYTLDELADIVEHKQLTDKIKRIACTALSIIHTAVFLLGVISLGSDNWPVILAVTVYCFVAAIVFGLLASRKG